MRLDRVWLVVPFVLWLAACGDEPTPSAPSPAPAAATVRSIHVSPSQLTLATGQTEQLSAIADMSDGSSRSVNNEVTWVAADPHLATISGRGVVTAHAHGTTLLFARLGERTSNLAYLTVPIPPELLVPVTGLARDQHGAPVRDASVAIVQGEGLHPAVTDANGFFDLGTTYGTVRLDFSRFGFDDQRLTVGVVSAPRRLEVTLIENPSPAIERRFDVVSDGAPTTHVQRIRTRAGARLDVLVEPVVCGFASEGASFVPALRDGATNVVVRRLGECAVRLTADVPSGECVLEVSALKPGRYVVRFREPR